MRFFVLVIFFICAPAFVFCQQQYWQQQVNYDISVSLNDVEHTLQGFEKITYFNNSPDSLHFLYVHVWMNAYKNDRTDFSEQLLKNDRSDFYFSNEEQRGYINQLDFRLDDKALQTEETNNIDIIKIILPTALAPKQSIVLSTPFHVKLPYDFSRGGHIEQSYQATQWYPKIALYDKDGWHAIPYLDQGEFYNDFGNYSVNITLPDNYKVGATGVLEKTEASDVKSPVAPIVAAPKIKPFFPKKVVETTTIASSKKQKILFYNATNVTDFAWFADKSFIVKTDTIILATHVVKASCYILPEQSELYANSMKFIKRAVRFYSNELGEYPFPAVNVVCSPPKGPSGGMEYPMITIVNETSGEKDLDETIAHEIGHNWLMAILGSNERDHGWMDEGMNTYFENKYMQTFYPANEERKKIRDDFENGLDATIFTMHKDQPIENTSAVFTVTNYDEIVYVKTGAWLQYMEKTVGKETMQKIMHTYFDSFAFKHPQPEDFKRIATNVSGKDLDTVFRKLQTTGFADSSLLPQKTALKFVIPGVDNRFKYITFSPVAGYNNYDKVMIGATIHNYQLPLQKFQFLVAPMYATGSSKLTGTARFSYNHFTARSWFEASVSGISYSINDLTKEDGTTLYFGVRRIVPSLKYTLYNKDLREKSKWVFQARSFIVNQDQLKFSTVITGTDTSEVASTTAVGSVINQLRVSYENNRIIYPYSADLTIDEGDNFLRIGFTGKYFFDYNEKHEGVQARLFAGKFFKLGSANDLSYNYTNLNMSGPKGNEDYTFSNYFIGRNEFEGWMSQQIMERDGFFKVRTDQLLDKVGKTNDWLIAVNLSGNIPEKINPLNVLPVKLPVKLFLDIGTYSEAWKNETSGRFLYDAGIQISIIRSLVNVYLPILYSKVYGDYFKSYLGEKRFAKTISFDINLNAFKLDKLSRSIPW